MSLGQALIFGLINLCDQLEIEWQWLDDGNGIQVDLTSTDEFRRQRFLKETKKLRGPICKHY